MAGEEEHVPVRAAVLVPLLLTEAGPAVVLTRRTDTVSTHAGQIAFPGGRFDSRYDRSLLETALREAEEEIALRRADVEILGVLPEVRTLSSGFLVTPFVARLSHPHSFVAQAREVAEVFTMPLQRCRDPGARIRYRWTEQGTEVEVPAIEFEGRIIWGLTLRILDSLLESDLLEPSGALHR